MPYFERVKKLSNMLFAFAVLGFLITIINFFRYDLLEGLVYNYVGDIRAFVFTVVLFLLTVFGFVLAISLRYIAEDAKEYVERVLNFNK
ncbi:hypothetical protein DS745_04010 [Anaerobacillus alkaliphilus]|uniref:Uncharacterized protein n=1 Tax=Anaerobacillus alkaliphilus TaxID=1548597 RepID=A0A4Q0VXU2_9BACI|nr:hypothetical protein DS745_04010 [Anaerobacillus alkaliphilus]